MFVYKFLASRLGVSRVRARILSCILHRSRQYNRSFSRPARHAISTSKWSIRLLNMASHDSTSLCVARAMGTVGLGLLAGYMTNIVSLPCASRCRDSRVHAWQRTEVSENLPLILLVGLRTECLRHANIVCCRVSVIAGPSSEYMQ